MNYFRFFIKNSYLGHVKDKTMSMKGVIVALVCAVFAFEVSAQQVIKSNEVGAFSSINLSGKLQVELIKSDNNAIEITLTDSDITRLKWGVTNEALSISLRPTMNGTGRAVVKIYYKGIDALSISSGELTSKDVIDSELFDLKLSGSATVTLDFKCLDIDIEASSNSVALLKGYSKYINLRASEKSKLEVRDLECISAVAMASTGGEIYVCAQERLEANAKTGSTIFYKGSPTILRVPTSKFMGLGASVHNIGS